MESRAAHRVLRDQHKRLAYARAHRYHTTPVIFEHRRHVVIRISRWQAFLAIFKGVMVWVAILTVVGHLTLWIN